MRLIVENKLKRAFSLSKALADSLEESSYLLHIKDLPSNSIGEQFWCIIGARESFIRAITSNNWMGFSCSLTDCSSKTEILKHLSKTSDDLDTIFDMDLNENQKNFMMELLEHEIQHHGQLIRYMYANTLSFPKSWNDRYTV